MSYPGTDIFLLCFSVVQRDTFKNIKAKWVPEVRKACPKAPIVLVGTKSDLRETEPGNAISASECERLAKEIGAVGYSEVSAMKNLGVKETFEEAIRTMVEKKKCVVL
jgi:GTPase SAR1 family protein